MHCKETFQELNRKLTSSLVLIFPNSGEYFVVYCDASKMDLNGVLKQNGQVVA